MSQPEYPKWIKRSPQIGAVLVTSAAEEKQLLADWDAEQLAKAEEAAAEAQAAASAAKEEAQLALKSKNK